jgi:hypothetical protein
MRLNRKRIRVGEQSLLGSFLCGRGWRVRTVLSLLMMLLISVLRGSCERVWISCRGMRSVRVVHAGGGMRERGGGGGAMWWVVVEMWRCGLAVVDAQPLPRCARSGYLAS